MQDVGEVMIGQLQEGEGLEVGLGGGELELEEWLFVGGSYLIALGEEAPLNQHALARLLPSHCHHFLSILPFIPLQNFFRSRPHLRLLLQHLPHQQPQLSRVTGCQVRWYIVQHAHLS